MKSIILRTAVLAAMALGLAACGGKATFDVGGTIEGLQYPGLVLVNNGGNDLAVAPKATTFKFPNPIEYGTTYSVDVKNGNNPALKSNPLHQDCKVLNKEDTAGRMASINIVVICTTNTFDLGGKVSGLTADGLVLVNGSDGRIGVPKDATGWAFPVAFKYDSAYGVTILAQPAGLNCTVANPIGVMGDAPVSNVDISCTPKLG